MPQNTTPHQPHHVGGVRPVEPRLPLPPFQYPPPPPAPPRSIFIADPTTMKAVRPVTGFGVFWAVLLALCFWTILMILLFSAFISEIESNRTSTGF